MAHYIISYDLHNQRTYQPIWDKLNSWGAVRLLESLWVATLNGGAGLIREELQKVADSDDSVIVIELTAGSEWSAIRARAAGTNWLTTNIRSYG